MEKKKKDIKSKWHLCYAPSIMLTIGCSMSIRVSKAIKLTKHCINLYQMLYMQTDSRIDQYPLTSSPMIIIAIIFLYVYFVTVWGQRFMKSRQAYELNNIIKIYNFIQIILNLFMGSYVSKLSF